MAKIKSCGFIIFKDRDFQNQGSDSPAGNDQSHLPIDAGKVSFLLMKHPSRWDLPKGHVDEGETNMQCALRELEEETGICQMDILVDPDFKYKNRYLVNNRRSGHRPQKKKLIIYAAKLVRPVEITPTEHDHFQWFDWQPPHQIQPKTIDPLLTELAEYWQKAQVSK